MAANANEIFTGFSKSAGVSKVLAVEFSPSWDDASPFKGANYSRFSFTVIEKIGENKKILVANLPAREATATAFLLDKAMNEVTLEKILSKPKAEEVGDTALAEALAKPLAMGKYKGKTLGQLRNEDLAGLKSHRAWLAENVAKYPRNKQEIDQIDLILRASEDEIKKATSSSTVTVENEKIIYDGTLKFLQNKKKGDKCLCYQLKISWEEARKYPVKVNITNMYAPLVRQANGSVQISLNQAEDKVNSTFYLSKTEGISMILRMKELVNEFETSSFNTQMLKVNKLQKIARDKAKATTETTDATSSTAKAPEVEIPEDFPMDFYGDVM